MYFFAGVSSAMYQKAPGCSLVSVDGAGGGVAVAFGNGPNRATTARSGAGWYGGTGGGRSGRHGPHRDSVKCVMHNFYEYTF